MNTYEKKSLVYVVDDEERNLLLTERALSTEGYAIQKFHNGLEVLEGVMQKMPDIIILDVMMPKMDGFTVCETLKKGKATHIIPIILVTGLEDMRDKVRGLEAGADDFITKPFHPMELRARVKSLLRIKTLTDELQEKNSLLADENLRLEALVKERTRELDDITLGLVASLEKANLLSDTDTGKHILRVCNYSTIIAKWLNLDPKYVNKIARYASLHDIGKVGIADSILKKQGKLTSEELEEMKKHTIYGYDLLKIAHADIVAQNIALSHHEKFDGTGYPYGVKGEMIPIEARIVALADVYDALTTKRCYKEAYSGYVAEQIIKQEAGKHFDPAVVDSMIKGISDFNEIREKYED